MEKQFIIIIGRSGCGKGTQAGLLKTYLGGKGLNNVVHFTTGGNFRDFVKSDSYIASLSKEVNEGGALQPEFLAVWNFAEIFIKNLKGGETIILDGTPRRLYEVEALYSAIKFMGYKDPIVIYLNVSETWAIDKLGKRGREDDKDADEMKKKMDWFEVDVLPVLAAYKDDPRYTYVHVNGEQTVEEVHQEIISKI